LNYDTIVIGAGISGLTAASLLAKRGLKVVVIDSNFKPGGSCGIFKREGVIFDQGSSMLYGFGEDGFNPHRFVFNCLEESFNVIKHDLLYCVNFKGKKIRFWPDVDKFIDELSGVFPSQRNNIKKFYSDLRKLYKNVMVESPVFSTPDETDRKSALKQLLKHPISYIKFLSYMNKSTYQLLSQYFNDPEIFKFFDKLTSTYCYTTVKETPAILSAIMFINNHEGGSFYPAGSTLYLPGKLEKAIEENGGEMLLGQNVSKILIDNGKAKGVLLENGEQILGENIIYSGTVWNLYAKLIDQKDSTEEKRKWAKKITPTYSSMVFYASINGSVVPEDTSPVEMLVGNPDAIDETEVTVYIPSLDDKTLCPIDTHVVIAIGPSFKKWPEPGDKKYESPEYEFQKEEEYIRLIKVLEKKFPKFKDAIIHAEISTPTTIEKYTHKNWGCVAGPKQAIGQHMLNRLHTKSEWDNIFLCGESTVMGTGTPAVTVSGISAANAVLKKYNLREFIYDCSLKNYVNLIEKPVTFEKLYDRFNQIEKEIVISSSECLFCEDPLCMSKCNLDIRAIMRRVAIGNFYCSIKITNRYLKFNPLVNIDFKLCESTCIRKRFAGESVKIEKIIEYLKANLSNSN
jgi:prolycopene isomerase